jgi:bcr-type benzoyl-CoA reductase subunit C
MEYTQQIENLMSLASNPDQAVKKTLAATGKKAIGCFPIYTPEEIIYAAGAIPIGMWGGKTELSGADRYLQAFCCSIMRSNIEYGVKGSYNMLEAVIIPTFCDTLKCVCENWKVAVPQVPVLPIVYPQHRLIEAGYHYLIEELDRMKGEIEKVLKVNITEEMLEEAFQIYEEYRKTMREFVNFVSANPSVLEAKARHLVLKASWFMDKKEYTGIIRNILEQWKEMPVEEYKGIKVVATGLISEPVEILDVFQRNGIAIVADDLAQESRQFRVEARKEGSVLERLAARMVDQRGCAFIYEEEKTRGQMLINMVQENHADAVIVFMMKFCDPEEFDYPIYKKELEDAGIPFLYLEIDQQLDSFAQIETRIQSFTEMLQ